MNADRSFSSRVVIGLALVSLLAIASFSQQPAKTRLRDTFDLGRGMSPITADLIPIAVQSTFFLKFADDLQLTADQRKSLEALFFKVQQANVRSEADLDVVDAELRRALSSDSVDMADVRAKVTRMEKIRAEGQIMRIQATLHAIAILTHEQHLKAMMIATKVPPLPSG